MSALTMPLAGFPLPDVALMDVRPDVRTLPVHPTGIELAGRMTGSRV